MGVFELEFRVAVFFLLVSGQRIGRLGRTGNGDRAVAERWSSLKPGPREVRPVCRVCDQRVQRKLRCLVIVLVVAGQVVQRDLHTTGAGNRAEISACTAERCVGDCLVKQRLAVHGHENAHIGGVHGHNAEAHVIDHVGAENFAGGNYTFIVLVAANLKLHLLFLDNDQNALVCPRHCDRIVQIEVEAAPFASRFGKHLLILEVEHLAGEFFSGVSGQLIACVAARDGKAPVLEFRSISRVGLPAAFAADERRDVNLVAEAAELHMDALTAGNRAVIALHAKKLGIRDCLIEQRHIVCCQDDPHIRRIHIMHTERHAIGLAVFDGDPYCVIPEELAVQKLFLHQAEIDSIEVSDQEVLQQVETRISWLTEQIGSKEKLEEYYNKTSTQIREMLRENIRDGLTVQEMQKKIVGDIKLTPAEVRNYFSKLPQDSIPFVPTQVEVQIITREPKIKEEEIERVKKELRDFTDRINKGETTFSTLARMYSEDPGSARRGGEYGFTGRGELTLEFANVVFNLTDPKKISKVFETEYGYHIAQLIEKRGDRVSYRHILIKPRVDEKEIEAELNKLDTLANDIRKGKVTFDEAATWVSQDKDTRNNHGLLANPQTSTSRFEMQQLAGLISQEVAKTVEGMQIGEVSKPFTMINAKGKEVCAIVKLKNRIDGHKATISEDYQRLKDIVTANRSEEKLQKWIVEKQKNTYVRINPSWRKCDFKYPGWIKQ